MKKHEQKVVYRDCHFYPAENAEVSINLVNGRIKVRAKTLNGATKVAAELARRITRRNTSSGFEYR